jgi:hypothetical protein
MEQLSLTLPFAARGESGQVRVYTDVCTDPVALGFDLCAVGFDEPSFHGFPVVRAELDYRGHGYRAHFGWLQVITRTQNGAAEATVDLAPWSYPDTNPLFAFGLLPTFFDAPANPGTDHHWIAETYLVASPDVARSRRLATLAAFTWGYDIRYGEPSPIPPASLDLSQWDTRRPQLSADFPTWAFMPSNTVL